MSDGSLTIKTTEVVAEKKYACPECGRTIKVCPDLSLERLTHEEKEKERLAKEKQIGSDFIAP